MFGFLIGYLAGSSSGGIVEECFKMETPPAPEGYRLDYSILRGDSLNPQKFIEATHGRLIRKEDWDDSKHVTLEDLQEQGKQQK